MSEEQIFFEAGSVKVTSKRVVVGSQTYALSGITSVRFLQLKPRRLFPLALLVAGFLLAKSNPAASIWHYLIFVAPGAVWLLLQRSTYTVQLNSSSGESRALQSKKRDFIEQVVAAINQAIVVRS
jgi:hypothetical protein